MHYKIIRSKAPTWVLFTCKGGSGGLGKYDIVDFSIMDFDSIKRASMDIHSISFWLFGKPDM